MNRPVAALGLTAVALALLAFLVADMEQAVEDPSFQLGQDGVDAATDAAEHLGPGAADALGTSGADSFTLPDGTTVTLPQGTEIDGDLIRLAEAMAWTLPAGTTLENLELGLPPGTTVTLPPGTEIDGETFVFPPGSTIVLEDGTELELPQGGTLTMPGASSDEMRTMLENGEALTREGSVFSAPEVTTTDAWPVVFPEGTEFRVPEGMDLPQGKLPSDMDVTFPEGSQIHTTSAGSAEDGGSLFDKVGNLDLSKGSGSSPNGGGFADALGGFGGGLGKGFTGLAGTWWAWVVGGIVVLVAAFLVWRHRDRLRALMPASTPRAERHAGDGPVRAIFAVEGRTPGLPLAFAPGQGAQVRVRVQVRNRSGGRHSKDDAAHTEAPDDWRPSGARIELHLDGKPLATVEADAHGSTFQLPALAHGTHRLTLKLDATEHPGSTKRHEQVHVAPWNEQVARDYDRVYQTARDHLRVPDEVTPRVLASVLAATRLDVPDHELDDMIRTFEQANYSTTSIEERDWLTFATTAQAFIDAIQSRGRTAPPSAARAAPAAPVTNTAPPAGATDPRRSSP